MDIRKGKSDTRGPYRSYDHSTLSDAYIAVKESNLSIRGAAKKYGVPLTTLIDRLHGRIDIDVIKSGSAPLFSQEQEALLAQHLKVMAEVGYGYSRSETINLASDYAVNLGIRDKTHPLTDRWLYKFLGRWPDLKIQKPRGLEVSRAKSATRSAIDMYFSELDTIMNKYDLHEKPHLIYNIDEKGLSTDHKPPKIISGLFNKTQAVTSGRSKTVTLIGCCNGIGQQVPPYFIFPGERMLPKLLDGSSPGTDGTVSSTGWSNSDIFSHYMKIHLVKYLPARDPDTYLLVLYDGHKSHVSLSLIEWAKQRNIILFVLPPHCSHLLQPLDVGCFGPFEVAWNSACHHYLRESGGSVITRFDVCNMACKVYSKTLTAANIQASFKKCGIFPYNPNVVSDSSVAPATTFDRPLAESVSISGSNVQSAESFLLEKGGKILENVQKAKVRNTLSKVVGGKAITENHIVDKIKEHYDKQGTKQNKQVQSSRKQAPKRVNSSQVPSVSGVQQKKKVRKEPLACELQSSDSEESDMDGSEKCIVCKKFQPVNLCKYPHIILVKWGQCDMCDSWVHLTFCSPVRVLRRGDSFFCPTCTPEQ